MIHKYSMLGENIVVDVNSGAVHSVDDAVYELMDIYKGKDGEFDADAYARLAERRGKRAAAEALEEIKALEAGGQLFSPDDYPGILASAPARGPVVKALCLHIAHDCNLRCGYCFAGEGKYRGTRSLMSLEVGKRAIDFLIASSGARRNLEVDFFGGEPTLNMDAVKQIVSYAKAQEPLHNKRFRFTLTTNGLLLNDGLREYINENMHNVVLSLDGRREVNDRLRKTASGGGSYDLVVEKMRELAESRNQTDYYVRGTFTRENLDFAADVLHLAELGFKQISVEPVVADARESYALTEEDLPALYAEYEKLTAELLERGGEPERAFNFFHFMIDLEGGPCVAKRLTGCGSGTEYLAVTPEGDLYPCHQFVGMEDFKLGDIWTGVVNTEKRDEFARCSVYSKPECKSCWAKFYCSGGCAASAYNTHGDITKPYGIGCLLQRKRTECAILLKAAGKTRSAIDAEN